MARQKNIRPDEFDRVLMPLEKEFQVPAKDKRVNDTLYFFIPKTALMDGAENLSALNATLSSKCTTTLSLVATLLFGAMKYSSEVGEKIEITEYTKMVFGSIAKMVPGVPTRQLDPTKTHGFAQPDAPEAQQSAAYTGHGRGRDPGIHPPESSTAAESRFKRINPKAGGDAAASSTEGGVSEPPAKRARMTTQEVEQKRQADEAARGEKAKAKEAAAAAQDQGEKKQWYYQSAYKYAGKGRVVPKVRVVVLPIFRTMPKSTDDLSEAMDPKNVVGRLIIFSSLDPGVKFEELVQRHIDQAQEVMSESKQSASFKGHARKIKKPSSTGAAMKFGGDMNNGGHNSALTSALQVSSADNPNRYLQSKRRTQKLLNIEYHECLKELLAKESSATLPDIPESLPEGYKESAPIDLDALKNWAFLRAMFEGLGVCEEQCIQPRGAPSNLAEGQQAGPNQPLNQTEVTYAGHEMAFSVPPDYHEDTLLVTFPEIVVKRALVNKGKILKVSDINILWDLGNSALRDLLSGGSSIGAMTDGTNFDMWLPFERTAEVIRRLKRDDVERVKKGLEATSAKALVDQIEQDNDPNLGLENSRYVENCDSYLRKKIASQEPFAFQHPVVPGLDAVGGLIVHVSTQLSKIGVQTNHCIVFLNYLVILSSVVLGNHTMLKYVPPSLSIVGPTSMGKTEALYKAREMAVSACADIFSDESPAALLTPNKGIDMVVQCVAEATEIFSSGKLSGEALKQQRLLQTVITDKITGKTQYWEVPDGKGGFRRIYAHIEGVRRVPFLIAQNKIRMPYDTVMNGMQARSVQFMITGLTPSLDEPALLPGFSADAPDKGKVLDFTRTLHALHTRVWTHWIEPGIIAEPDLRLYKFHNSRIKSSQLFFAPIHRGPNMGAVLVSVLTVLGGLFYTFGNLSPFNRTEYPSREELAAQGIDPDHCTAQKYNENMKTFRIPLHSTAVAGIAAYLGPNTQASLFILSWLWLSDWVVLADFTPVIGKKLGFGPDFIRRCIQIRDRDLVRTGSRSDTSDVNPSYLRQHVTGKMDTDTDFRHYFFSEDDDQSYLDSEIKQFKLKSQTEASSSSSSSSSSSEPLERDSTVNIVQREKDLKASLIAFCTELHFLCGLALNLVEKLGQQGYKGVEEDDDEIHNCMPVYVQTLDKALYMGVVEKVNGALKDPSTNGPVGYKDLILILKAEMSRIAKLNFVFNVASIQMSVEDWKTLSHAMAVAKIQNIQVGIKKLEDLIGGTVQAIDWARKSIHTYTVPISAPVVQPYINYHRQSTGSGHHHSLPTDSSKRFRFERFMETRAGYKSLNWIIITFTTGRDLFKTLVAMFASTPDSKFKAISYEEMKYYVYIMTMTPVEYYDIPDVKYNALPVTAEDWGTVYDPANLCEYPQIIGKLLVLESNSGEFNTESSQDEQEPPAGAPATDATTSAAAAAATADSGTSGTVPAGTHRTVPAGDGKKTPYQKGVKKAYLNVQGMLATIDAMTKKFMKASASSDTTPGQKVVLGIPGKNIRFYRIAETMEGISPSTFHNPLHMTEKLRKACREKDVYVATLNGDVKSFTKGQTDEEFANHISSKKTIDLSGKDEETELYESWFKTSGVYKDTRKSSSCHPAKIRENYKMLVECPVRGIDMAVSYPDDFV